MSQVKENDTVKVHYTGKLQDGQVFDSSVEREPLEFTLGQGMLIPGFEKGIIDMKVEEKKTINIPQEIKPEVGMGLVSKNPDGSERQLRVAEVNDDHIVVDANHPLAGKDLVFDLELVEIK